MNRLEAVIFDWAGTTVDYGCFAPVQAFVEMFKAFYIEPTLEEVRKPMGMLKRDHIKTMLAMPRIREQWEQHYGRPSNEEDIDRMYPLFEGKLLSILKNFAEVKPGVAETVGKLREKGIAIGSTTGYTDLMMQTVVKKAQENGYAPDAWFSPDSTAGMGRPYPYMVYRNMEKFHIKGVQNVAKVGDTISDILEGKNAGVFTIGVLEGSSQMGLLQTEYEELDVKERDLLLQNAAQQYREAGADAVILNMGELIPLLEKWFEL